MSISVLFVRACVRLVGWLLALLLVCCMVYSLVGWLAVLFLLVCRFAIGFVCFLVWVLACLCDCLFVCVCTCFLCFRLPAC